MTNSPLIWRILLLIFLITFPGLSLSRSRFMENLGNAPGKIFFIIFSGILILSLSSFVLALFGFFSIPALAVPVTVIGAASTLLKKKSDSDGTSLSKGKMNNLIILIILIAAAWLYVKPHGYIFGGWDPGIYVNTGASIAREGSIRYRDDFYAGLGKERTFFSSKFNNRFDGFDLKKAKKGLTTPHFYHLLPALMAVMYSLVGPIGPLLVTPFFALISTLAFYVFLSMFFSRPAALGGTALLAFNINQIWFSRFPVPETAAQFFIISGLICLVSLFFKPSPAAAFFGALSIEAAALAKVDALPLVFILLFLVTLRLWTAKKVPEASFGFFLLAAHSLFELYRSFFAKAYTNRILAEFGASAPGMEAVFLAVMIFMSAGFGLRILLGRRPLSVSQVLDKRWRGGLASVILILGLLAYYQPFQMPPQFESGNLISLGWLLTPPGLLVSVLGICLAVMVTREAQGLYILASMLPMSFLTIASWKLTPIHFWATKRYQSITIPAFIFFAVFLYDKLLKKHVIGRIFSACLLIVMIALPLSKSAKWINKSDYHEYPRFIADVAGHFSDNDIILCRNERSAVPLHFLYGLETLVFNPSCNDDWDRADTQARLWTEGGRRVHFLGGGNAKFTPSSNWEKQREIPLKTSYMVRKKKELPTRRIALSLSVPVYSFSGSGESDRAGEDP